MLLIALASLPAAAQRLVQGTRPAKASVGEFAEAVCSTVSGGYRVCRVRVSDDGDAEFAIVQAGSTVDRVPAPAWRNIMVEPEGFFAYRGDLDGNGTQEIVLVSLEGVSNGLGVSYSTVYIFDGGTIGKKARPISFPLQEFGERENFIYDPAARRTDILISYWGEYSSIEPKRIPGVYLVGKWFRYRNCRLEPVLTKPTLARRYLNSFAAERANGGFEGRKPFTWLKDRRTHKFFREPQELSPPERTELATVTKYASIPSADGEVAEFDLVTEAGNTIKARIGGDDEDAKDPKPLNVKAVGLWRSRYLYPLSWSMGFNPATYLDRIEGRRVRLETYKTEYGGEFTKVWLLD